MRHTIYSQVTLTPKQSDQLLHIVRGKSGISKNQVIQAINRAYDVVSKIDQIFKTAPTGIVVHNISGSTLHTKFVINT